MKIQIIKTVPKFLALVVLVLHFAAIRSTQAHAGSSTNTGSMAIGQIYLNQKTTGILLKTGKVLSFAGITKDFLEGVNSPAPDPELYDPVTGTWKVTPLENVTQHTPHLYGWSMPLGALIVLTNGNVLYIGGVDLQNRPLYDTDLFNVTNETWALTGRLNHPRFCSAATLLPDGRVLVIGGEDAAPIASAEIYSPSTGLWTTNGSLLVARAAHSATLLPNGKVLVMGGFDDTGWPCSSAEIYDPGTGTATPIVMNNAAKLSSGAVQISATNAVGASLTTLASTNPALPATNWSVLGSMTESPPGQFKFTDTQATNIPQRFYRVRSP